MGHCQLSQLTGTMALWHYGIMAYGITALCEDAINCRGKSQAITSHSLEMSLHGTINELARN